MTLSNLNFPDIIIEVEFIGQGVDRYYVDPFPQAEGSGDDSSNNSDFPHSSIQNDTLLQIQVSWSQLKALNVYYNIKNNLESNFSKNKWL